jgi:hypothetical protein
MRHEFNTVYKTLTTFGNLFFDSDYGEIRIVRGRKQIVMRQDGNGANTKVGGGD